MFFALAQPQVPHQLGEVLKCRIVGVPVDHNEDDCDGCDDPDY